MFLVVGQGFFTEDIFVDQFLQLKQGASFVSADVPQVVGAGASDEHGARIFIFLYVHLVEGGVVIVFYAESDGAHQVVMFEEFYIADGMYFFSSSYDFVCAVVVDEFEKVRQCHVLTMMVNSG